MKTTLDIADNLLIAAKKKAAEERKPLRQLVEQGLRLLLGQAPDKQKRKKIKWVVRKGGLPPGVDISSREKMWEHFGRKLP